MTDFKVGDLVRPTKQALVKNYLNTPFNYTQQIIGFFGNSIRTKGVVGVELSWDKEDLESAFMPGDILKPSISFSSFLTSLDQAKRYTFIKLGGPEPLLYVSEIGGSERQFHWHNLELHSRPEPQKIVIREFNTWLNPKNKVELKQEVKPNVPGQLKLFD